jgi:hypothetical protein
MASPKTKKSRRSKWLIYSILFLILLVSGYKVYDHFSIAANKRAFQNARAAIDNIYFDSIKQLGPADSAEASSDCSRTYKEFTGYTDLTCEVDTRFIYAVVNESEASGIFKKVQAIISQKDSVMKPSQAMASSIKDSLVVSTVYHSASDTYKINGLSCTVNYIYDTPREIDLSIKNPNMKPFEITIGCSGPAKQQYYRLAS